MLHSICDSQESDQANSEWKGRDPSPSELPAAAGPGPRACRLPQQAGGGQGSGAFSLKQSFRKTFPGEIPPVGGSQRLNAAGRLLFSFAGNKLLETATWHLTGSQVPLLSPLAPGRGVPAPGCVSGHAHTSATRTHGHSRLVGKSSGTSCQLPARHRLRAERGLPQVGVRLATLCSPSIPSTSQRPQGPVTCRPHLDIPRFGGA